jgi:hypothetical protein
MTRARYTATITSRAGNKGPVPHKRAYDRVSPPIGDRADMLRERAARIFGGARFIARHWEYDFDDLEEAILFKLSSDHEVTVRENP